jgi:LysR family transcriptional activator of mexEF-oprN operon
MDDFNEADFRGVDLNALLTFVALIRAGSVKGAAERLYLGSPAVSMALARLRTTFGDALMVRTREGMQPTKRALALYAQIEPALARIHRSLAADSFDPRAAQGSVELGIGDDLEPFVLPALLHTLAAQAPGLRLVARSCNFRTVAQLLDSDAVELAVSPTPLEMNSWHRAYPLFEEHFVCVYDSAVLQPAGRAGGLSKAQYFATPHVVRATDGAMRTIFDQHFEAAGLQRTVAAASATFLAAALSVKGNRLLANMPSLSARLIADAVGLAISPIPAPVPPHTLSLLCHARREGDARTGWLLGVVRDVIAGLCAAHRIPFGTA